jgi:hypothetical protein
MRAKRRELRNTVGAKDISALFSTNVSEVKGRRETCKYVSVPTAGAAFVLALFLFNPTALNAQCFPAALYQPVSNPLNVFVDEDTTYPGLSDNYWNGTEWVWANIGLRLRRNLLDLRALYIYPLRIPSEFSLLMVTAICGTTTGMDPHGYCNPKETLGSRFMDRVRYTTRQPARSLTS